MMFNFELQNKIKTSEGISSEVPSFFCYFFLSLPDTNDYKLRINRGFFSSLSLFTIISFVIP